MQFGTTLAFAFAFALAGISAARAEDPLQPPSPMKDVVEELRRSPATAETMHFEMTTQNTTIGYMIASLRPAGSDSPWLEYRVETVMKLPNGVRLDMLVTAQLTAAFEPKSIDARREGRTPNGKKQLTVDHTRVREKDIALVREEGGIASLPQSIPRPDGPFVFGVEFLVQRVDAAKYPAFLVHELNPQTGETIVHTFRIEPLPEGMRKVNSRKADGNEGYAFTLDATGKLLSWSESPVPVISKRCTEGRIAEIKSQLGA